jgi:hypothetical protein
MNEHAAKASRAEEVLAAPHKEVTSTTVAASSAGDVDRLAAIAARPAWSVDVEPRLQCEAPGCRREAVAWCAVDGGHCYCGPHIQLTRRTFPERLIVELVDCPRCRQQGPRGPDITFEGENPRHLCRDCAELVRALVEGIE